VNSKECPLKLIATAVVFASKRLADPNNFPTEPAWDPARNCIGRECAMWGEDRCGLIHIASVTP
jgi:hypothetical protein